MALLLAHFHYIIPIWNWSSSATGVTGVVISLHYSYMELERSFQHTKISFYLLLHYSYMELELSLQSTSYNPRMITLFLYGIGAKIWR